MGFTGAQAENLTFPYGGEKVLDGLDVEVPKGKITGIVGHSGSGKCPFMENKTFCSNCKVHCCKPEMRERIRALSGGFAQKPCNPLLNSV